MDSRTEGQTTGKHLWAIAYCVGNVHHVFTSLHDPTSEGTYLEKVF